MRKLKLLIAAAALTLGGTIAANAQASYNHTYTTGVEVAAGGDYFLYNIGAGMFLTDGMDFGTHGSVDHAGRVITLAANTNGYSIYTKPYSANGTAEKAGFLTLNGYVDTGANDADWVFTPVTVDGYTNAYTIKHSDTQYLYYEVKDGLYQGKMGAFANVGNSTNDAASYWLLIPMSARQEAKDYTYLLRNTDFHHPWELPMWTNSAEWTNIAGGKKENACAEMYGKGFDISQTISVTVANGKYKLYNQAFYNNADAANMSYLYANNDQTKIAILNANNEGTASNMAGASESFTAGNYVNEVSTIVTNGSLKVGIKNATTAGNAWTIMDNFYLEYLGTCLVNDAVALPATGEMEANKWYYVEIGAAANNYKATATTLSDIICTSDGTQLTASATGDVTLLAENNSLEAKRYYVKSSSNNNLVIAAASYSYTVGIATADMAYIQPGNTVTILYEDLSTNDPIATLTKDFTGVKLNGETIALTVTDKGFTFTVPTTITAGSTNTLSIPSGAIGYAGYEVNADQDITLTASAVFDGIYYMYNTDTKTYISRGGSYNTQAIMDNFGLAFIVKTDANNNTQLQYFDSYLWLGDDGFCYADCGESRRRFFNVTKVADGFKFLNTNNNMYLAVYDGAAVGNAEEGVNLQGTSNVWKLESTADHVANYAKNADTQAATAATAAGIVGITNKADLETELANNYCVTTVTVTGAKAEKYQIYPGQGIDDGPVTYYSETVNNLKPGIYKLSVDAFQRAASNEKVFDADGARGLIYLYAGDAKTQLKSVSEYGNSTQYANTDFENNGLYYPNRENSAYDALATGNYSNDVYVYVADAGAGTGSLEIGIKNPSRLGGNFATWAVYNNWTLTYFEAKATDAEKQALANAISDAEAKTLGFETGEYAPYNNIAALEALTAAKALDTDAASGAAVVEATTALTGASWTANTSDVECVYNGNFAEGQGSPAANIQQYGWTRTNGWGQFKNDGFENSTAYYNQPGSLQYGNAGVYTMPLKANTVYNLTFKYASWESGSNNSVTASVLNGTEGMAEMAFEKNSTIYKDGYVTKSLVFVTKSAGDYILTLANGGNTVITGVSITKAANQVLEFADGTVPTYAPGTYPSVKITRSLTAGRWATAVYPFKVSGVDKIAVLDSYTASTAALGFKTADASEANVPFLMRSTDGTSKITLSNVEVAAAAATDVTKFEATLKGTYTETTVEAGTGVYNYVMSNNTIYKVGEKAATIKPYRAYIQVTQPQPASGEARALTFFVDGETTTAIEGLNVEQNENGQVYNLQGQRVVKAQKGLFIKNGKKVVVK